MLTEIDGSMLAKAFPCEHRPTAILAGDAVAQLLEPRQWTEQFSVEVERQSVLIPARLHFASEKLRLNRQDRAWDFARGLQTRSNDGFERQRAARDVLSNLMPWGAPFIVALIGEYIVEILDDIAAALTPELTRTLGDFIIRNPGYWDTTKRRVTSYWNVYYRATGSSELRHPYGRAEYVGFQLVEQLETAAFGNPQAQAE